MKLLERMTNEELIDTTQESTLDYDIRIEASKEYLKRMGVMDRGETNGLHEPNGRDI